MNPDPIHETALAMIERALERLDRIEHQHQELRRQLCEDRARLKRLIYGETPVANEPNPVMRVWDGFLTMNGVTK